jgi:hypothetical protein
VHEVHALAMPTICVVAMTHDSWAMSNMPSDVRGLSPHPTPLRLAACSQLNPNNIDKRVTADDSGDINMPLSTPST